VFDKHSCGFVNLGSINDQLMQVEQGMDKPIANHVMGEGSVF